MRTRQILSVAAVVCLLAAVFPAAGEAAVFDLGADRGAGGAGFVTWLLEQVQSFISWMGQFVTAEGSTPTGNG